MIADRKDSSAQRENVVDPLLAVWADLAWLLFLRLEASYASRRLLIALVRSGLLIARGYPQDSSELLADPFADSVLHRD